MPGPRVRAGRRSTPTIWSGRLTSRQDVAEGNTSTFAYGSSATAHNVGRLQSTSSGDGSYAETFTYDAAGRLSRRHIVADATVRLRLCLQHARSARDAAVSAQHRWLPVQEQRFEYAGGQLVGVVDASATPARDLWRLTTMDAAGRPIDERLGSNIQLLNGYDDTTGLLETRTAGVAGATTLQDLEYTWDDGDKLTQPHRPQPGWPHGDIRLRRTEPPGSIVAQWRAESRRRLRQLRQHRVEVRGRRRDACLPVSPDEEARRNGGRSQCLYVRRQRQYAEPERRGHELVQLQPAGHDHAERREQQSVLVRAGAPAMETGRQARPA